LKGSIEEDILFTNIRCPQGKHHCSTLAINVYHLSSALKPAFE